MVSEWLCFSREGRFIFLATATVSFPHYSDTASSHSAFQYPVLNQHLFVFPRAIAPLVLHRIFKEIFPGWDVHPLVAFPLYFLAARLFMMSSMGKFNALSYKYGFLDGESPRDKIPDIHSKKVL